MKKTIVIIILWVAVTACIMTATGLTLWTAASEWWSISLIITSVIMAEVAKSLEMYF